MDGGITRQSEQYGIFEDRPRPERVAREAPQEVIREYTRGRSVGAGQLNPRNIRRHHFAEMTEQGPGVGAGLTYPAAGVAGTPADAALENGPGEAALENQMRYQAGWHTPDFDPRVDAGPEYYEDHRPSRSDLYADEPHHMGEEEYEQENLHDPHDFIPGGQVYDWEGNIAHGLGRTPHRPDESPDRDYPHPFGTPTYNPRSSPYDTHTGSRLGFNRVGQGLMTHIFTPGNRVGLPYNGSVISGIVHQIHPDSEVGVRWEDGQYSKESPGDIQPL